MNIIETILNEESFQGDDGKLYKKVTKELRIPRKTFMRGTIEGKYRGDLLLSEEKLHNSSFYDFEIYEAQVSSSHPEDFKKNKEFIVDGKAFPKEKLPNILLVELNTNERSFGLNILQPKLYEFKPIAKYHQTEGDEVFGCFKGKITGYILDYEKEIVEEILGPFDTDSVPDEEPILIEKPCVCSEIKTGNKRQFGNYIQYEYFCKYHDDKIWGDKIYKARGVSSINHTNFSTRSVFGNSGGPNQGCFSDVFSFIAIILGVVFIIAILPGAFYLVGLYLVLLLFQFITPILRWIFRIFGALLLLGFISAMVGVFTHRSTNYHVPKPRIVESPRETELTTEPIVENNNDKQNEGLAKDSVLKRFRVWEDYDGVRYEGHYQMKLSDYKNAAIYKRDFQSSSRNGRGYDEMIYNLKQNDKDKLNGLYKLFDSIGVSNNLNKIKFAEMVVTFVQDIPYALVLEEDCNPNLYNDPFIKKYLSSKESDCISFQKFGINTPVEFLVNLKGDCDTRTLLLYTIFAHYSYDVVLMSSEQYMHSVLGINLPIEGLTYKIGNQKYVLWETTGLNFRPGIIPNEISNLNNWRISLKSK